MKIKEAIETEQGKYELEVGETELVSRIRTAFLKNNPISPETQIKLISAINREGKTFDEVVDEIKKGNTEFFDKYNIDPNELMTTTDLDYDVKVDLIRKLYKIPKKDIEEKMSFRTFDKLFEKLLEIYNDLVKISNEVFEENGMTVDQTVPPKYTPNLD